MAFPTTSLLDDFNRADADPISGNWTTLWGLESASGNMRLQSNRAGDRVANAYWNASTFGPDCEAWITMDELPTVIFAYINLFGRVTTPGGVPDTTTDCYGLQFLFWNNLSDPRIRVVKYTDGSGAAVGSEVSQTFVAGDKMGMEILGSNPTTINGYRYNSGSWTQVISRQDSTSPFTAAGYIGFGKTEEFINQDDFGGGTIVSSGPADHPPMGVLGRGAGW